MGICNICGQPLTGNPHVCPVAAKPASMDRQSRGNVAILAILVLSFGLFAFMLSFVLFHPAVAGQPILIQTATPGGANNQGQQTPPTTISASPTITPTAISGGSGGPFTAPTATPRPNPKPTSTPPPPTPTDPPPTRLPQ
jgi:hypothetical protein